MPGAGKALRRTIPAAAAARIVSHGGRATDPGCSSRDCRQLSPILQSSLGLVWRLLSEYGFARWSRYAIAFVLMAIGAGATARPPISPVTSSIKPMSAAISQAVVQTSLLVMLVFSLRGAAMYGHSVILSRVGNSIVAENQRRLFDRLQQQNLNYFGERHSSELLARLSIGAAAASQALNLVITAIGRDFLTLTALTVVMLVQDPIMSLVVFVDRAADRLWSLRKLVKRIKTVAMSQWRGGAQTLETLQETMQGIRLVKSFTLEDQMRQRFHANVASVQSDSNKMARVSNRTGPLIETLAGLAIAIAMVYAGHRVINTGASPGEFFSFMTAFLLAYEPAKRLARLNLDLNIALVEVRVLFEVIDSPATEPDDEDAPATEGQRGAARIPRRDVLVPRRRADDPGHVVRGRPRPHDRAGRPVGRRQVDGAEPHPALLRHQRRRHRDRRPGHRIGVAPVAAQPDFLCRAGRLSVPRHDPREHRIRPSRRERRRHRRGRQGGAGARFHQRVPEGLRHHSSSERGAGLVRRRAPARRDCARAHQECAADPARRGDRLARTRNPSTTSRRRLPNCARAGRPSSLPTGSPPSCMPTRFW